MYEGERDRALLFPLELSLREKDLLDLRAKFITIHLRREHGIYFGFGCPVCDRVVRVGLLLLSAG